MNELPQPSCKMGFTYLDIQRIFPTHEQLNEFMYWMRGQTGAICQGEKDEDGCPIAHGMIIYVWDVDRYLLGLPVID